MKLLIFSLDSYSVFHTDTSFIFGGIEIETGYHAKGLALKGLDVVVLTRDQGIPEHIFEKISIVPHTGNKGRGYWNKRTTIRGRISYRIFGDKKAKLTDDDMFGLIKPDVAYIMGMSREALNLSRYCIKNKKPFIFRIAHDMDLGLGDIEKGNSKNWANLTIEEASEIISNASVVLTQTPVQDELLKTNFGREGELMFPPIEIDSAGISNGKKEYDVLWVGKNNSFKRPEKLVELARRLPHRKFCFILNNVEDQSWKNIVAGLPENVVLIESVPADEIENKFRASKVFVSTSLHEGFANTFLQAGKNAVPVISMGSDPNGMLSIHAGGVLVGDDMGQLEKSVEELLKDEEKLRTVSAKSKKFVETFHDKNKINKQFYDLLINLKKGNSIT